MRNLIISAVLAVLAPAIAVAAPATSRDCIGNRDIRESRQVPRVGYFVRTGQGWWQNSAQACSAFGPDRTLVTRSTEDRKCRGDIVEVIDAVSGFSYGSCGLDTWQKVDAPPPK